MAQPTTGIYLNSQTPDAPAGYQNAKFATDGATPQQAVTCAVPSTGAVNPQSTNYTLQASDCGKIVVINSPTAVTVLLPASVPFNQWSCQVANIGSGAVTLSPGALHLDGSAASLAITQGQSCYIATDGTNYFSGKGMSSGSGSSSIVIGFIIATGTTGNDIGPMLVSSRGATVSKCVVVVKASDAATALTLRINQNGTNVFTTNPTVAAGTVSGTVMTFTTLTSSPLTVSAGDVFTIDIISGTAGWLFTAQLE